MTESESLRAGNRRLKIALAVVLLAIAAFVYFKGCKGDTEPQKAVFPEKSGKFETVENPAPAVVHDTVDRWHNGENKPGTINQELYALYLAALNQNDSLAKAAATKMYAAAITENQYEIPLENDLLKTTNKIKVLGTLQSFDQEFTIKRQEVDVPKKETVLRVLAGGEVGATKTLDNVTFKANLAVQNKRGDVFSFSVATDQTFYLGYSRNIFELKK